MGRSTVGTTLSILPAVGHVQTKRVDEDQTALLDLTHCLIMCKLVQNNKTDRQIAKSLIRLHLESAVLVQTLLV